MLCFYPHKCSKGMNVHWTQICQIIIDRGVREHLSRLWHTLLDISDVNGIEDVIAMTKFASFVDPTFNADRVSYRTKVRAGGRSMFASVPLIRSLARQRKNKLRIRLVSCTSTRRFFVLQCRGNRRS